MAVPVQIELKVKVGDGAGVGQAGDRHPSGGIHRVSGSSDGIRARGFYQSQVVKVDETGYGRCAETDQADSLKYSASVPVVAIHTNHVAVTRDGSGTELSGI